MNRIVKVILSGSAAVALTAGFVDRTDRTRKTGGLETAAPTDPGNPARKSASPEPIVVLDAAPAAAAAQTAAPPEHGAVGGSAFRTGDKLKIMFYQRVDFQEDKWTKTRTVPDSLEQRTELSGEFLVQDDGTISLPLLGRMPAAGRTAQELQSALQSSFGATLGHDGFVTITLLERQPIYILGPVKNPGSYAYAPGMTVLHAVALAGGLDRSHLEPWQQLESVRETERSYTSVDHLIQSLARVAVLQAERDGTTVQVPQSLIDIAGEAKARGAINAEVERRKLAKASDQAHERTLATAIENGKEEIATLSGRIAPIEEDLRLKDQRASRMHNLASRNIVDNTVMDQVQSELLGAQQHRQEAVEAITLARQRLAVAEQEKSTYEADKKNQLEQEIDRSKQESIDLQRDLASSRDALSVVQHGAAGASAVSEDSITYQVVRRSADGTTIIDVAGTADLQPGDLVRLRVLPASRQDSTEGFAPRADVTK